MLTDYEHNYAVRQAHEVATEDEYFAARPQIDSNDRRKVFEAGFVRGWDKQAELIAELERQRDEHEAQALGLLEFIKDQHPNEFAMLASKDNSK